MGEQRSGERGSSGKALRNFAYGMVLVVVIMLIVVQGARIYTMLTPNVSPDAELNALERANDAVSAVEMVLSFLEGASVLIGLGFGAAALYGIRNTDEVRQELENEIEKVRLLRDDVLSSSRAAEERDQQMQARLERQMEALESYRPDLERLKDLRQEIVRAQEELALVQQADQEFRLGNHQTAYAFARQVLETNPHNWMALYIAGWLEVHQLDRLDDGIEHLKHVIDLKTDWPAAKAAYGVALRRKARKVSGEERANLFHQAEGALLQALGDSPRLKDFNEESFWGPVGGIRLETNRIESAIEAFTEALKVTPDSSYPAGNLATLYLKHAHQTGSADNRERALNAFDQTVRAARREQLLKPNDYYLWMDIAQAQTILGYRDTANFTRAQDALASALQSDPSNNLLETSLRGWHSMLEYCPAEADWQPVRDAIQQAVATIQAALGPQAEE